MKRIKASPHFIRTPTVTGWVLRLSGDVPAISRWGGDPKPTVREAVDAYADPLRAAFPDAEFQFMPARPAQVARSLGLRVR